MTTGLERERFALLSIFFPMWNEEEYIYRAVRAATEICERLEADGEIGDYEIIVVDDASTDALSGEAEVTRGSRGSLAIGRSTCREHHLGVCPRRHRRKSARCLPYCLP